MALNVVGLVGCGALWVATGAWWALSPVSKQAALRVSRRVSAGLAPRVGPFALLTAMAVAVAGAVVLTRPFGMHDGRLTVAGWVVAALTGVAFVSLQTFGAMVVLAKLGRGRETEARVSPSKAQDDETF